jgi:hypothetical protein
MRIRSAVVLTTVTALLLAASALAASPLAAPSMDRARADAAQELASVRLPHAAKRVGRDPSVDGIHPPFGQLCVKKYTAWDHAFWRTQGTPRSVWQWIEHHPPLHTDGFDASGKSEPYGKSVVWQIMFPLKNQTNVQSRTIYVTLAFARGGGTAIRVDALAVRSPVPPQKPCAVSSY